MNRLHPQDLRAMVAAIMAHDLSTKAAVAGSDFLLAELERTAKSEPPPEPQAEPCPECGCTWPKNWHWPECSRILPQAAPSGEGPRPTLNLEAAARAVKLPLTLKSAEAMLEENEAQAQRIAELDAKLDAIEAAKAGEPGIPEWGGSLIHLAYNTRSWGRLGWDTAAALKVERDRYREALKVIANGHDECCPCVARAALEVKRSSMTGASCLRLLSSSYGYGGRCEQMD